MTTHNTPVSRPPIADADSCVESIRQQGYVIIPDIFTPDEVAEFKEAFAPYFVNRYGRSDFEGFKTERVYALLAKNTLFSKMVEHPLVLSIVDQFLASSYLLWGFIATNIHPGETPQEFHTDDEGAACPRPRGPAGISMMWAFDDFTEENGATEIIPGSHLWPDGWTVEENDPNIKKALMKAGSVMIWAGTLVHRGGANRSDHTRLGVTTQYCQPWLRQVENGPLAVPPEKAAQYSDRIRQMLGYGVVEGSFMGYVDGMNPIKLVEDAAEKYAIEPVSYFD